MNDDYLDTLKRYMKYYDADNFLPERSSDSKMISSSIKRLSDVSDSFGKYLSGYKEYTKRSKYDSYNGDAWYTTEPDESPEPDESTEPEDMKIEMTEERRQVLKKIMEWYWQMDRAYITKSDYEFVYDLWDHGLSFYGEEVKERLNNIRTIYLDYSIQTGKDNK